MRFLPPALVLLVCIDVLPSGATTPQYQSPPEMSCKSGGTWPRPGADVANSADGVAGELAFTHVPHVIMMMTPMQTGRCCSGNLPQPHWHCRSGCLHTGSARHCAGTPGQSAYSQRTCWRSLHRSHHHDYVHVRHMRKSQLTRNAVCSV